MRPLITQKGTHSPEKWAVATSEMICPIAVDPNEGDRALAAKKLQTAIAEALMPHHVKVHEGEHAGLKANGDDHFDKHPDPTEYLDEAVDAVSAAAVGTPWETHFAGAEVRAAVRHQIGVMFVSHQDVERQHHADKNPGHAKAQAYKAARHGLPVAAESES